MGSYGWLVSALVCLSIGYMLIWQRGFYTDDYNNRLLAIDALTGQWEPIWSARRVPTFPVRTLAWLASTSLAGLMPTQELFVRSILTLGVAGNALLLGGLVYRIIGSRLAGVVSGWLFLMPIYAQEAVLWVGASAYIFGIGLALLFLHAFWSGLTQPQRARGWFTAGALALIAMLLFVESPVSAVGFLPALALIIAFRKRSPIDGSALRTSMCAMAWLLPMLTLVYFLLYRSSTVVAGRGSFDLSPAGILQRSGEYFSSLVRITISPEWGWPLTVDVLRLGLASTASSWPGVVLAGAAIILILLTALRWRAGDGEYDAPYRLGILVCCLGVAWFAVSLLFPGVLVTGQILEYRLLYFPVGGTSVAIGAVLWMAAKRLSRPAGDRLFVAMAGILLLSGTIYTLGFARAYAARSELDQKQIAAVSLALPLPALPENSYIVPFDTEEELFGQDDRVSKSLVGVFETSWSARAALVEVSQRKDFRAITGNRWIGMRFAYADDRQGSANDLSIQGISVPPDRILLFTYRSGKVRIIENLTIVNGDGSQHTVHFPIAEDFRRYGVPTIDSVSVPNS